MSILVRFPPAPGTTTDQYDAVLRRVQDAGEFPPAGLEYHVAFTDGNGDLRVSEVWESAEQFQAFGERLMPIIAEQGIQLSGEPEILEVYNTINA
jgi:hypothetical protein